MSERELERLLAECADEETVQRAIDEYLNGRGERMGESISELCRKYRMEHGISQTELASRCGVSLVTISKAEHGKKLQLITMGKILKVVGESP